MNHKPYAPASAQNSAPILEILSSLFAQARSVLEIGSGTGQHAVHFAARLTHLTWQASDVTHNLGGIRMWLAEAALDNTPPPLELDVTRLPWPHVQADAVFTANTVHIMHWPAVEALFAGVGRLLTAHGIFAAYGPFRFGGEFTTDSNARFDARLRADDPGSGVRNFEDLDALAGAAGLRFSDNFAMPANNHILCWRKVASTQGVSP